MDKNGIRTALVVATLLIAALCVMAVPATAEHDLKVTDYNRNKLHMFTYIGTSYYSYGTGIEPQLLRYPYGTYLNTHGKSKNLVWTGSRVTIRIGNGQCVDFVKAVSNTANIASGDWIRGNHVLSSGGIAQGTVIATFKSNGRYDSWGGTGHVAVFDRWHWTYSGGRWNIDGFYVWDANYVRSLLTGRHLLKQRSSGVNNANNYYVVRVP